MKLTDQVCNLDLARTLEKLGVRQESYWLWWEDEGEWKLSSHLHDFLDDPRYTNIIRAFTVAELGEMLPPEINWGQGFKSLQILLLSDQPRKWDVRYYLGGSGIAPRGQSAETEADARAKMLIYLLENKLISV